MSQTALIVGCAGPRLDSAERELFAAVKPWGLILFKRNCESPAQISALTQEFRGLTGYQEAPVFIDQEGGRVQRLGPPQWPNFPPAAAFGAINARDPKRARETAKLGARLIAQELLALGITADCLPVADLRLPEGHGIIGDRAYGETVEAVTELARAASEGLMEGGVLPVMKHIPGHGRANADSHEALPTVSASRKELEQTDFEPFRRLKDLPMAMTAHVLYSVLDQKNAATVSRTIVQDIIRGHIGFEGLLMTDDLSMKALKGSLRERAEKALEAGCDMILHCNGDISEMQEIAAVCPPLEGAAARRAAAAIKARKSPLEKINLAEAHARFSAMLTA
ncbi:MAG TPA: beta-N-acetylhexosaminidase [Xanthobacteraceae bacterium]|nr:beta-N-acetylhexosaminidase [Xanthobacteraceae bacterium]